MRLIRDVLRLKYENGLIERATSAALGISKGAIGSYVARARAAGLSWPLPPELNETALERLLFPGARVDAEGNRPVPDYHVEVDGHWYSVPFRLIGQVLGRV